MVQTRAEKYAKAKKRRMLLRSQGLCACKNKVCSGVTCQTCRDKDKLRKSTRKDAIARQDKIYQKREWAQYKVNQSRRKDKKYNLTYMEEEYLTNEYNKSLRTSQHNLCYWCYIPLQIEDMSSSTEDGLWIERLDDTVAHIKTNCVLSCPKCNMKKFYMPKPYKTDWLQERRLINLIRAILHTLLRYPNVLRLLAGLARHTKQL